MKKIFILLVTAFIFFSSFLLVKEEKPVLYIIGDSTVRNGDGTGKNGQWGWGSFIADHFDTTKINISNQAIGGRSSRTFITDGRWDRILATLKKGDYVIMQFGHNDASPLDDTARARGTIKGIGDDSTEIYNPIRKIKEVVHTYGWYMRRYIRETKAKGAIAIVCSLVPRDNWKDGKVVQSKDSYAGWAQQLAKEEGAYFIDLNKLIAIKYEKLGAEKVKEFFPTDHTHTNKEGAELNAQVVVGKIKKLKKVQLRKYLK
jgi:rhamnogalacturonan acetylesterase